MWWGTLTDQKHARHVKGAHKGQVRVHNGPVRACKAT